MWDFSLRRSFGLMMSTLSFVLFRCMVYFGIALAYVLATGLGAGVGWGVGGLGNANFQAGATVIGGLAGLGIVGGLMIFLREYLLYVVKAGHIAVLVQLLDNHRMPDGQSQVRYAGGLVKDRFGQTSILFALDQLIKGVVRAMTRLLMRITRLLPIPGLDRIEGLLRAFLRLSVGLVDEVILAYIIRTDSDNPWKSAQSALVLYGQNAKGLLKNAAWLLVFTYGLTFLVFLLLLAPAGAIVYFMPGGWASAGFVFALIFAWAIKASLVEPFAIACLLQAYFKLTEGQTPDPEWEERLAQASDKFRELSKKAGEWVTSTAAEQAASTPAAAGTTPPE